MFAFNDEKDLRALAAEAAKDAFPAAAVTSNEEKQARGAGGVSVSSRSGR